MPSVGTNVLRLPRPPQRPPACRACKRRKSKCDFEQPCSTCLLHNTVDNCLYDTLAVPRERRSPTRRSQAGTSSSAGGTKTLKSRLLEAEKLIMIQQKMIDSLQAGTMHSGSSAHELPHDSDHLIIVPGGSKDPEPDDDTHRIEEDSKPHTEGLADKMTRLVIGSAIAPAPSANPEVTQHPDPTGAATPERAPHVEAQQLQINVLALLASHDRSWTEFARGIGLAPLSSPSSTSQPVVSTTILPEKQTITNIRDLIRLFPPTKAEALALLDNYLSFVNLVHHVVDGPQTRYELEAFYDLPLFNRNPPAQPSPMPIPPLLEPGWLSSMLAIFTLADKSERCGLLKTHSKSPHVDSQWADQKCKMWLEGSLQGLKMRLRGDSTLDLAALRSVCLVVWVYVLYGRDDEVLPAVNLNSSVLYRACDKLQLHRDPIRLDPTLSQREAEDRRRVFYNLLNTDWLFSAISGKTYSPVGVDGHDVRLPSPINDRDALPTAITGLAFRSKLMRQLRRLATLALGSRGISQAEAARFENQLDRLDHSLPAWCEIDVDNFPAGRCLTEPQEQAEFSQQIITNVQLCAVRVRFHTKFASPGPEAPDYMHKSASHHRAICIARAVRLLRLEQLHLKYSTRTLGHSGYPRFHPIVGGLTLSALMAKSTDHTERLMLFEELSRFTAMLRSYGTLSQVTNFGILAIETALAEVRRGALADQALRLQTVKLPAEDTQVERSSTHYSPSAPVIVHYPESTGVELHSAQAATTPLPQSHVERHSYEPSSIMFAPKSSCISSALKMSPDPPTYPSPHVGDLYGSESLLFQGDTDQLSFPHSLTSPLSPITPNDVAHNGVIPDFTSSSVENLFCHIGAGVGYEGLMVGWMGAGANSLASNRESSEALIPPTQPTWVQEW